MAKGMRLLRRKYSVHKSNAKRRLIDFHLTFDQWFSLWQTSGKIKRMGRRSRQYCMARLGDAGAYEVGNVHIVTCHQNRMELSAASRQQMSLAAKRRVARVPTQELKQRMKFIASFRDPDEKRRTASRQGKRLWASMTAAQQLAKMKKMRTARWSGSNV